MTQREPVIRRGRDGKCVGQEGGFYVGTMLLEEPLIALVHGLGSMDFHSQIEMIKHRRSRANSNWTKGGMGAGTKQQICILATFQVDLYHCGFTK